MNKKLKIIFMGTPAFSVAALNAVIEAGHDVICVYTQPPRPAGRGHHLQKSAVHLRAEELHIPVRHPLSLKKDAEARATFAQLNADIAVVAAYGLILPQDVLDAPQHGCLNIHASLLPRWRGAAPIQRAILAGDTQSGVCIMQMEAGLDTGPVLMHGTVPITQATTASILHDALAAQGAELIVKTLDLIAQDAQPQAETQPAEGITYAHMLSKEDGRINWAHAAADIERQLRALHPWPGVWCMAQEQRLKVLEVSIIDHTTPHDIHGKILDRDLTITCGTGSLRLMQVQPENRKAMDGASLINGGLVTIGDILT